MRARCYLCERKPIWANSRWFCSVTCAARWGENKMNGSTETPHWCGQCKEWVGGEGDFQTMTVCLHDGKYEDEEAQP